MCTLSQAIIISLALNPAFCAGDPLFTSLNNYVIVYNSGPETLTLVLQSFFVYIFSGVGCVIVNVKST